MKNRMFKNYELITGRWPLDEDDVSIVFIHGSGQCASFWDEQVKGLSDIANTIALSLPGHGKSKGGSADRVSIYAGHVANFIKEMDIPNPMVCGLSIGGAIALHLMIHEPALIRAGVLLNTGARLKVSPTIVDTIENDYDQYKDMLINVGVAKENQSEEIRRRVLSCSNAPPEVTAGDFTACNGFDVMNELGGVTCPALVLTADKDLLTPAKYGAFLAEHIPHATLATIKNAGHMSPVEKPDAVNRAIRNFIKKLT